MMLAVGMCEGKVSAVQPRAAAIPTELTPQTKKRRFFFLPFFFPSSCVFERIFLQVVGLDAHQRPDSRGDPAGEGKGRQSGSPEGPESRHGSPEDLGRKLPGRCERWWSSLFVCQVLHVLVDIDLTLVSAEARQPRHGCIICANYQRAAAERQIHAGSVLLQCPQGEKT